LNFQAQINILWSFLEFCDFWRENSNQRALLRKALQIINKEKAKTTSSGFLGIFLDFHATQH